MAAPRADRALPATTVCPRNYRALQQLPTGAVRDVWHRSLQRRSQRGAVDARAAGAASTNASRFRRPASVIPGPTQRFAARMTRGGSPVREIRSPGSVRGAARKGRPYRNDRWSFRLLSTPSSPMPSTVNALRTIILYAPSDAEFHHELRQHLTSLTKEKLIELWSLGDVSPGADQEQALEQALDDCDIVVLLLSADFAAICWHLIERALDYSTTRGVQVVPVRARPVDLGSTHLRTMRALPAGSQAVSQYASRDDAWMLVVSEFRQWVHGALGMAVTTLGQTGTIAEFDPIDALGWIELDAGGRVRFGSTSLPREEGIGRVVPGMRVEVRGTTPGYKGIPKAVAVVPLMTPRPQEMIAVPHRIRLIESSVRADARVPSLDHRTIRSLHKAAIRLQLDRGVLLGGISSQFVSTLRVYPDSASQMLADLHELNAAHSLPDCSTPLLTWLDNACILAESKWEFSLFSAVRQDLGRQENTRLSLLARYNATTVPIEKSKRTNRSGITSMSPRQK